ncbi:uncharacterized protein LOC130446508 [Diorhabda sublineata]|uniref:uncharacterized protein LOC130446508 n=1 Tax=Diorhabda sublineata TaxID=1163346 RepID=UPI0024E18306|nr:uncharacterized protein LOC130446508 [Diorhabda sublineata]
MDKTKNKDYFVFKDINGNLLKLHVQEVSQCLKIRIIHCGPTIYQRCTIIFIIASIDMILLLVNIVSISIILAILCFVLILTYTVCNMTIEENLVVIKDIGIEIAKIKVVGVKRDFFPHEQVQNVFINEVIYRNKVLFVLTLLISGLKKSQLVPLFTETFPQLALLKTVFNYMKRIL